MNIGNNTCSPCRSIFVYFCAIKIWHAFRGALYSHKNASQLCCNYDASMARSLDYNTDIDSLAFYIVKTG